MSGDTRSLLDPTGVDQLRTALTGAGFTPAGITGRLGAPAVAAAGRGDHRAALRATADRDPLATLIRLFVCGRAVPTDAAAAALGPLPLADAVGVGLVVPDGDVVRQGLDLDPFADGRWVVSDVPAYARQPHARERPLAADHVLGVGEASRTLLDATLRRPVGAALDLGTGCGVQALHLADHAGSVTATDVSARALRMAATTAALSGQRWELACGDLAAPVAGRRFDLVVSNPPFVVGPGAVSHAYRDSGRQGDAVSRELAALAPRLLTGGGVLQFLANWEHVAGEDWRERVAGWFTGTGCDAWVIQREVTDPLTYVRLWRDDAEQRADDEGIGEGEWLDWFDAQGVEAVGFGVVTARRTDRHDPVVRVEDLRQQVEHPFGEQVGGWFDRQDWLRGRDRAGLLDARYVPAPQLGLHQEAMVGDEGWRVERQLLAMPHGLRWSEEADQLVVSLVGAADGRVALRHQLTVVAAAYGVSERELVEAAAPLVARLVERGMLLPVDPVPRAATRWAPSEIYQRGVPRRRSRYPRVAGWR